MRRKFNVQSSGVGYYEMVLIGMFGILLCDAAFGFAKRAGMR